VEGEGDKGSYEERYVEVEEIRENVVVV